MSNTEENETFTFEVNRRQLRVIRAALDMYTRVGMGHLEIIEEFFRRHFYEQYKDSPVPFPIPHDDDASRAVKWLICSLKAIVFGHPPNGSWGIFHDKVPAACREAYDIRQIVGLADVAASEREGVDRSCDVDSRPYMSANPEEPPIKIESSMEKESEELYGKIPFLCEAPPDDVEQEGGEG